MIILKSNLMEQKSFDRLTIVSGDTLSADYSFQYLLEIMKAYIHKIPESLFDKIIIVIICSNLLEKKVVKLIASSGYAFRVIIICDR